MNLVAGTVIIFVLFAVALGVVAFVAYRRVLRRAKGIERGLKMVPLLIHLPPPGDSKDGSTNRDSREVMRERVSQAQVLYDLIAGTAQAGFRSSFYGQRHMAFEIIASNGLIHFFVAVPVALVPTVEQAILTAYPGARVEEVEDHNIFNPQGKLTGTVGGELTLKHSFSYPIATSEQMERDPMEALLTALSKLQLGEGAGVQIMLRPASSNWTKQSKKLVGKKRHQRGAGGLAFTATDLAKAAVKAPDQQHADNQKYQLSKLEESIMQAVEDKTRHPGYEVLIRVISSSTSYDRSEMLLRTIANSFALYEAPGSNGFQFLEGRDIQGLVTAFIFRFFPPEVRSNILNTVELATLFHLPDSQFTATARVERQQSKQVDGPVHLPNTGLLLGYNFYRGVKKEIRLSLEDRRRHGYVVGQTGTGKTTLLENLAVQDMLSGGGFAFIDPHGDAAERLLSMVPKERAEDVVYFNPADTDRPLGLNLFEASSPEQKDFLIQESINMLYKMYDENKTGIIGPRFEHWYRNAALTLMADPDGSSFIELPKVFTDTEYLKKKFKYLKDPTVIDFWTKEMGQTSDYHKSEMLGWFVSKFGAFQTNEMMRNIIGQTESAFNIRDIMDQKKILIVNLSKGQVGEINSQLLGMLFVIKIQAAAMSRANTEESQRPDFCLYVDEFQNFSTDSFASILSEARKYHLNLVVGNQFIGQLTDEIREAVFGNIGTIISYRTGPEDAEFLVKQFQPVFDQHDLINLPNYNAVIKLLIGGLPSQPFSMTALPPLGRANAEIGLAVKQLSAAKFGVPRAEVEADIFARLQGKPRPARNVPPAVSAPAATVSSSAASVAAPATQGIMPPVAPTPTTPAPVQTTTQPTAMPEPRLAPPPVPVAQQTRPQVVAPPPAQVTPTVAAPAASTATPAPVSVVETNRPMQAGVAELVAGPQTSANAAAAANNAQAPAPPSASIMDIVGVPTSKPTAPAAAPIATPAPPKFETVDELAGEAQHELQDVLATVKPDDIVVDAADSDDEPVDAPVLQPASLPLPHTAPIDALTRTQRPAPSTLALNQSVSPRPAAESSPSPQLASVNPPAPIAVAVQSAEPAAASEPTPVVAAPVAEVAAKPQPPARVELTIEEPIPVEAALPAASTRPAVAPTVTPQQTVAKPSTVTSAAAAPGKTMIATHKTKQLDPINLKSSSEPLAPALIQAATAPAPQPEPPATQAPAPPVVSASTPPATQSPVSTPNPAEPTMATSTGQPVSPAVEAVPVVKVPESLPPAYADIAAPRASGQKPNTTLEPSPNPLVTLPTPPQPEAKPAAPKLRPGEVYVDDDGNVVQG